jgi:hypothetical protein
VKFRSINLVALGALAILALIQTSSDVQAGKIMRAAKWAAGEAVKAALVEYAKHEANGNFETFKRNFCGDKGYRTKVLSSPAINPLIGDQGSAEDLILETLGCGYELGKINVVFTGAALKDSEYGPGTCEIKANLRNYSKHHLNKLMFEVGRWRFEVGDMVANSYEDDVLMSRIDLGNMTCLSAATYLVDNLKDAAALECSIPNLAEGDCQGLISFSTTLNAEALGRIGAQENFLAGKRRQAEEAAKAAEAQKKAEQEKAKAQAAKEAAVRETARKAEVWATGPYWVLVRARAEQGDRVYQYSLGQLYYNGEVVPRDYAMATQWLRKAAAQDEHHAQFLLATIYENGTGAPQDYTQALRWYQLAGKDGWILAQQKAQWIESKLSKK